MCGRFVSASNPQQIAEYFGAAVAGEELPENFNVAPTNDVYAVVAGPDGEPRVEVFQWGLVPVWAKDVKVGSKMINARAETIAQKPVFKPLLRKHRCIVPMDGFYEWKGAKGAKTPMYVTRLDGEPLAVAGLWATWRDKTAGPDASWLHSCSVVTTTANATMAPVHDRMPVILPRSAWDAWLDPANNDMDALAKLLVPAPDDLLTLHPVSTDVNNVRNKGAELIRRVD